LFPAKSDLIFADVLADVLEPHWSLQCGLTVEFGGGIEELRSGDAACGGQLPSARFDEIVVDKSKDVVGLDPGAVAVDDTEAVGVAVGGETSEGFGVANDAAERREIFFGDVGAGAIEETVAFEADGLRGYAVVGENFVEVACAASVQRVENEFAFGLCLRL